MATTKTIFEELREREENCSQTSSTISALAGRSKDTQAAVLSLGMLNESYRSSEADVKGDSVSGRGVRDEEEKPTLAPETPQRAARPNPGTPLTPLANLKVLIAAASSAREQECASGGRGGDSVDGGGAGDDGGGRKMKSLSVLCQRFLSIAESEVGVGNDFSLELMSQNLGTNRRRIYDIINVLEALEMIVKQSKNWYTWLGKENLLLTLAKMRAMAQDDPDFRYLHSENEHQNPSNANKENIPPSLALSDKTNLSSNTSMLTTKSKANENEEPSSDKNASQSDDHSSCHHDTQQQQQQGSVVVCEESMMPVCGACGGNGSGGRWDKSLGVLCQKFVMLFLVTPEHEVTLDYAGNMLMPDCVDSMGNPFAAMHQPTNPKTKVRRLYDIANVLTTLGLIKKKTFLAPNHRKMPGYSWAGPSIEEINTIPVFRKNEFNLYPFYGKKKGGGTSIGGVGLTRKASFGAGGGGSVRPFLHQYEVKGQESASGELKNDKNCSGDQGKHSSAPTSPVKSRVVRRTLSFGARSSKGGSGRVNRSSSASSKSSSLATSSSASSSSNHSTPFVPIAPAPPPPPPSASSSSNSGKCVVARPLVPKQVDYLNEVKEFEAEMRKHSHKFPHVASVFQEFIQKYQTTLEQAASAGRTILPKPVPLDEVTPAGNGISQAVSNTQSFSHPQNAINIASSLFGNQIGIDVAMTAISALSSQQEPQPPPTTSAFSSSERIGNCTLVATDLKATDKSGVLASSALDPPRLIQLGDIDMDGVAKLEKQTSCESTSSIPQSPKPTLGSGGGSGTHGVLKSPGPSGNPAFMSVEDVMVRSPNPAKGTQTASYNTKNSDDVSSSASTSKPTALTALLKSGITASNPAAPQPPPVTAQNGAVQQALFSSLLNSLVNQSPIATPATVSKPSSQGNAPNGSKITPLVDSASSSGVKKVSPQVQPVPIPRAVSLANTFNPSMFLANPAHLAQQQLISAAAAVSSGAILSPNALLPNMTFAPYIASLPAICGSGLVQGPPQSSATYIEPSATKTSSIVLEPQASTTPPSQQPPPPPPTSVSRDTDASGPSPPKKPRLE